MQTLSLSRHRHVVFIFLMIFKLYHCHCNTARLIARGGTGVYVVALHRVVSCYMLSIK